MLSRQFVDDDPLVTRCAPCALPFYNYEHTMTHPVWPILPSETGWSCRYRSSREPVMPIVKFPSAVPTTQALPFYANGYLVKMHHPSAEQDIVDPDNSPSSFLKLDFFHTITIRRFGEIICVDNDSKNSIKAKLLHHYQGFSIVVILTTLSLS